MSEQNVNPSDLKKALSETVDQAQWGWLKPHLERDALILVSPGLDLVEVGVKLANDETQVVQSWIQTGQLGKPKPEQLELWNEHPETPFACLIVQPYVLIQERLFH